MPNNLARQMAKATITSAEPLRLCHQQLFRSDGMRAYPGGDGLGSVGLYGDHAQDVGQLFIAGPQVALFQILRNFIRFEDGCGSMYCVSQFFLKLFGGSVSFSPLNPTE